MKTSNEMSEFDSRARDWDNNPMHWERSEAIANAFLKMVPVNPGMKAMEYGAGTGILSFLLSDKFSEITLMDNSSQMIQVIYEKTQKIDTKHFKPLLFDLEHAEYIDSTFDCILSQMVLHHVGDTDRLLNKFFHLLNSGGYLAIADLYPEDGSFHGPGAKVHLGFDPEMLKETLRLIGFDNIRYTTCYEVKKEPDKKFPVFLLVARK
jgi:tRNA (cmo5U34)-methyltransferase